jgi:glutamate racemase
MVVKLMYIKNNPIGFFDSGVGGISVLKQALKVLPNENFIYYGDSRNAPYGIKTVDEVKKLSFKAVDFLLSKGAKAIVVACNTATSAAIEDLRMAYNNIPVIGIEPALKPAIEINNSGRIIIMATPMTLSEKKFSELMNKYKHNAQIESLPCPGLVELIENGIINGEEISRYLEEKFKDYLNNKIAAVVLGCTHYPFIKEEIRKIVGNEVLIIDGGYGTAKQLKRKLDCSNLLNEDGLEGKIEIYNSSKNSEMKNLCYKLLSL